MLFKQKNVSSCSLSFHFPCFPVPHPFHLSPGSLFQEPPLLVFLSIFSCVHRDQIDLSKTLALIRSFCLCPSWLRGKFIGSFVFRALQMGAALPVFVYSLARPKAPIVGRPTGLCAFLFLRVLHSLASHSCSPLSLVPQNLFPQGPAQVLLCTFLPSPTWDGLFLFYFSSSS